MKPSTLAIVGWWGGFATPFTGLIAYLYPDHHPLARSHGRASLVYWIPAYALYTPISVWSIVEAHYTVLFVAVGVWLVVSVLVCMVGTVQALRDRTLTGKALGGP